MKSTIVLKSVTKGNFPRKSLAFDVAGQCDAAAPADTIHGLLAQINAVTQSNEQRVNIIFAKIVGNPIEASPTRDAVPFTLDALRVTLAALDRTDEVLNQVEKVFGL